LYFPLKAHRRKRAAAELTLDELKKDDRVGVQTEPMCIFLFRDGNSRPLIPFASFPLTSARLLGTVISFNSKPNLDLTKPIATRIRQRDTSLRTNADPSLLVQSLLDLSATLVLQPVAMSNMVSLVVDAALEVVDEYRTRLHMLEHMVLIKSKVSNVRSREYFCVQLAGR